MVRNMKKNIKYTKVKKDSKIEAKVEELQTKLNKFLNWKDEESIFYKIELAKTTAHHKQGDIFRAEINLRLNGDDYRTDFEGDNLLVAIEKSFDKLKVEIKKSKNKIKSKKRKGSQKLKNAIKENLGLDKEEDNEDDRNFF
jgi:ribosome-associated translation inhibitor RaiA